jgi:ParB/RepB/Spo0J family partition protein
MSSDHGVAVAEGAIVALPTTALVANDYNPNHMTDDEFAELVTEVRHLGRLPKPIIVRPRGPRYVIVDGEHGWRAATEAGVSEVSCEIAQVDDFEAMRQTYKRNQHGTHRPVRLGQMFRRMMAERALSQRALAKDIDVSDGTIRNALDYAAAADHLRNSYAGGQGHVADGYVEDQISGLSVREVRAYLQLPDALRRPWLESGADLKTVDGCQYLDPTLLEWWPKRVEFAKALRQVRQWAQWEYHWCVGGLTREQLRPYSRLANSQPQRDAGRCSHWVCPQNKFNQLPPSRSSASRERCHPAASKASRVRARSRSAKARVANTWVLYKLLSAR